MVLFRLYCLYSTKDSMCCEPASTHIVFSNFDTASIVSALNIIRPITYRNHQVERAEDMQFYNLFRRLYVFIALKELIGIFFLNGLPVDNIG